jgi:hypothetical protein
MARDASGNYTLPAGNPVAGGTTITATWGNTTMLDVGTELTASLDRSGQGGMLAGLKGFAGTVSLPSFTFSSEISSGMYYAGTGDFRMGVLGTTATKWIDDTSTPAGSQKPFLIWNGTAWEAPITASGAVTSVDVSGGTTGLTTSGGPITTSGTITFAGTLAVTNGGTGLTAFGTGVATALGENVGSAGAFTTFNGDLGTPSALVLTNATGLPNAAVIGLGTAALVNTGITTGLVPLVGTKSASLTLAGLVEQSTSAENVTGTDDTVFPSVAGVKEMITTHASSDPTLGTLTQTFTNGQETTISLTSTVLAPVVTVTKEVPQTGVTNNNWDVSSTAENYTRLDSAAATTLDLDWL